MRIPASLGHALGAAAAVSALAGCSAGASQPPTTAGSMSTLSRVRQSTAGAARRADAVDVAAVNAVHGNQVIVADSGSNTVSVFGDDGHRNAVLTSGLSSPQGLAVDAAQTLYVANEQAHNIVVYPKPYSAVGLTLNDANEYPTGVAVSSAGIVGVTSLQSVTNTGGDVTFYAKGSTAACATVSDRNWNGMYFGAFDASGNLFMDGIDNEGNPLVGEVTGGCSATTVTTLTVGNTLYNVGGVQVRDGNILILDQVIAVFAPVVYSYGPPSHGSLGAPLGTMKLSAGIEPLTFALTKDQQDLWIVHSDAAAGRIKYAFPAGTFLKSFNQPSLTTASGIAVNPAAGF